MIGWMAFGTLLILVICFIMEMEAGFGRAFGWGGRGPNMGIILPVIVLTWVIFLLNKFHVITFWFQRSLGE